MKLRRNSQPVLSAAALALIATVLLCVWTAYTTRHSLDFRGPKQDYYNLLAQGFRKGHLYMDAAPDPALLALPPDRRPGTAPFLLDASLYHDRYYLYFGVVPAVLLYLPYEALTGQDIPEAGAALVFAAAGLFFSMLWWLDVRRRFFPESGVLWAFVSVLGITVGSAVASALRRPLFYEVAIAAGYAFMMLALWAFTRARFAEGRRTPWAVLGAVAAGLAVGSRANLGPACIMLVVCGAAAGWSGRERRVASALLPAGLAFGAVIAALGAYNAARFGNPLEFGHTYQLGVEPSRLFHLANLEHNTGIYYLHPPTLNGFFPFVSPAAESVKPADYVGRESAHGEWVWAPLAVAAIWALMWMAANSSRDDPPDAGWVVGLPVAMFAVNFAVTASVGVRANRYMLDFHPMLVLAVVAVLGMAFAGRAWPARIGAIAAGAGILGAAAFNVFGSMQAQGFFAYTDPMAYSQVAAAADRIAWPLLTAEAAAIGDRVVTVRWPLSPHDGAMEPIGAAGTPGYDDVLWIQYGAHATARFVYQYWEYGQAYGRWFPLEPGRKSEIRVSGAFLLPRPGHPWYGGRPLREQVILKRSLSVTVDGASRFERDVPSADSSPGLQTWGAWRDADGTEHGFSGAILNVRGERVRDLRAKRLVAAHGSVRMRLEFSPLCAGRYEPLLQSGSPGAFDTLVVHYSRPGFIQLVHDQLGSGARWSDEFPVDYLGEQHVEIDLPFADDRVDWQATGPEFRAGSIDRMRVTWNGRVVFEPAVPPVHAERSGITLGANMLHSSVCRAMFEGILEPEAPGIGLGAVGEGTLVFRPDPSGALEDERGIFLRFDRDDGGAAGLAWRRSGPAGGVVLGWVEKGGVAWCGHPIEIGRGLPLTMSISRDGATLGDPSRGGEPGSMGRFVVEAGPSTVLARRTRFFSSGTAQAEGSGDGEWSGTALVSGPARAAGGAPAASPASALPGRIRFDFLTPDPGRISSSPVLVAGRVGAADCVYLRRLPDGRYVVGLDHWAVGTIESLPFELAGGEPHSIGIEMGSLSADAGIPHGALRISVDRRVVMNRRTALYPVRPGEVRFGANALGMSTSARAFEGDVILVRTNQDAADLFPDASLR